MNEPDSPRIEPHFDEAAPNGLAHAADGDALSEAESDLLPEDPPIERVIAQGDLETAAEDGQLRVLTAPRGEFGHFSETLRKYAVLLRKDGKNELIIARGQRRTIEVRALCQTLNACGMQDVVANARETDAAAIAAVYTAAALEAGDEEIDEEELQEMETKALALFRLCVQGYGASDLHIQVTLRRCAMRMRVDGNLRPVDQMLFSPEEGRRLLRTIFSMAAVSEATYRPTESQSAQLAGGSDARVELPAGIDAIRVQFIPQSQGGRYASIRFQKIPSRGSDVPEDVEALGYEPDQAEAIRRMRSHAHGCVIVTGPTGSGKSRTLQCIIEARNRELDGRKAIFTVEDPVEYPIRGAAQRPVVAGATAEERKQAFQIAINDILRQDPDIVMVGEIRDRESGRLCFTIALTGHLVFTTLHANSALGALTRLLDEGVETWKLKDPDLVVGLVSQRLVPLVCPACSVKLADILEAKTDDTARHDMAVAIAGRLEAAGVRHGDVRLRGPGCNHRAEGRTCKDGYFGRSVIAETVETDSILLELVAKDFARYAYRYWIEHRKGRTMLNVALARAADGLIDPRDIEETIGLIRADEAQAEIREHAMTRKDYAQVLAHAAGVARAAKADAA